MFDYRVLGCTCFMFAEKSNIMTRSYCRLWVHAVFVTKNREALINTDVEHLIHNHLAEQLRRHECVPLIVNGMPDHVHLLFLTNYKLSLADIFQKVKGETSYWINSNKMLPHRFDPTTPFQTRLPMRQAPIR